MARRFSGTYPTFEAWLAAQPSVSAYRSRIARGHARYPSATLSQLRRHPRASQEALSRLSRAPPSRIQLPFLSPREMDTRARALEALAKSRREGSSLSRAAAAARTTPRTVRRYTAAYRKVEGRYRPTKWDRLERDMQVYEGGRLRPVRIRGSRTASLLGRHANAVKAYLETRDPRVLSPFRSVTFRDAKGRLRKLETDGARLVAAAERSERDYGQFEIYVELEDVVG